MFLEEGAAGAGFEILFEIQGCGFIGEGCVEEQAPGLEFFGVRGFALVVVAEAGTEIGGAAGVML